MINDKDIAVVGMSCIFPGAKDLESYWNNIINKVSAFKDAPNHRIDKVYYDPNSNDPDRVYCNKGGFIDEYVEFDPIEFGLVPNTVKGTEPDQLLTLKMAVRALEDAQVFDKNIPLEKSGIIIGKAGFGGVETTKVHEYVYGGESLVRMLRTTSPGLSETDLQRIKKQYQSQNGNFGSQNVMGTVPNITAAMVANRLNFAGPAYTIDGACASSILAIDNSIKELQTNRCDLMIAGAIHLGQSPSFWSVFSLLGAFSKSQVVRPFDKKADGVLPGEGCGFVVLRRLKDAIKDDQRIYAVIKGTGTSSDGSHASLMSPAWQGQVKAIKNAWEYAGLSYDSIGYIEAHGTATVLGDKTEMQTLQNVFGKNDKLPKAGIGSVKSMIGHTMPAAGIAGFIKTALALYHGVLPPTLNCDEPVDAFKESRFTPVQEATDWNQTGLPTIAGVNAFGFGGANSHIIIQKFNDVKPAKKSLAKQISEKDKVLLLARNTREELIAAIENNEKNIGEGFFRIAMFNPNEKRKNLAIRIINKEIPWRNKQDIWYTNKPLLTAGKKIAFLFPGLDEQGILSLKTSNYSDLAESFNLKTNSKFDSEKGMKQAFDLDESSRLLDKVLKKLGIEPDIVAGHSVGEWTACTAVEMVAEETTEFFNEQALKQNRKESEAQFLAISCNLKEIQTLLIKHKHICIANDNCTNQFVVCGLENHIKAFQKDLTEKQIINNILPYQTGYHTPFCEEFVPEVKHNVENLIEFNTPKYEIWSSISAQPYPKEISEIQKLHIDFLTKPVLFRQLTENIFNDGARVFIQIGSGSVSGFVSDTLKGKDISIISASSTKREALSQIKRVLAAVFIEGKKVNTEFLGIEINSNTNKPKKKKGIKMMLDLSLPFIDYKKVFSESDLQKISNNSLSGQPSHMVSNDQILNLFNKNVTEINRTQKELLEILKNNKNKTDIDSDFTIDHTFSLENYTELKDHIPFRKRSRITVIENEGDAVVPLTLFLDVFLDIVQPSVKGIPTQIKNVKIYQFLWVTEPVKVEIVGKWLSENEIQLEIENYISANIVFEKNHPNINVPEFKIEDSIPIPIKANQIYTEGYMFHGEAYQGIKAIKALAKNMIETQIVELSGKGSLLDTIGQSIGVYSHLTNHNLRAFPVGIKALNFYSNAFNKSGIVTCKTKFNREDDDFIFTDVQLFREGKLWCLVEDWQVRKSEIDLKVWSMMTRAEEFYISESLKPELTLLKYDCYKRSNTWFTLLNIYLNKNEINYYNNLSLAKQKNWLVGRIAAKDAIRKAIFNAKGIITHPATINIENNKNGEPIVKSEMHKNLKVSIAHKKGTALAFASVNSKVGVDIEEIKNRDEGFAEMVLNESEMVLFNNLTDKDEWITRFWVAKEAFGKSIGLGLQGSPKTYTVSNIIGETLIINNTEIKTEKLNNYIIGYTTNN